MTTEILGSVTYLETPTVNGVAVMLSNAAVSGGTVKAIYTGSTAGQTGTTLIPADATIPLNTEGTQLWTQTVTPASTASKFIFAQTFNLDSGTTNRTITAALFRGTTCVYATGVNIATTSRPQSLTVYAVDAPATTTATVYSLRLGISTAATWYVNQGGAGTITYGGTVNHSDWSIMEI